MEWHNWRFGQRFGRHVIRAVERFEVSYSFFCSFFIFQLKCLFNFNSKCFFGFFSLSSPSRFAGREPRWLILVFHISIVASRCWHRRKPNPKYHYWHFCCHFRRNCGLRYSHRSILQLSRWPFTNGSVHSVWIHGDDNVAKISVYHPVSEFVLTKKRRRREMFAPKMNECDGNSVATSASTAAANGSSNVST